jgi:hypothetical protein
LHAGTALAGITETGPIPPFITPLNEEQHRQLEPVARALLAANQVAAEVPA